ncbi:MAG TPA: hypothetical protein VGM02_07425 [Acidobacteriaceae bacterium]|jgi:hypothetical protein
MERIVSSAVRHQIENWQPSPAERALRMPLGLILLSRGWISHRELQEALAAQRRAQDGRIGEWLRRLHGVSEETITKALGIQWSCAVLPSGMPSLALAPSLIPAFLRNHYGLALLRQGSDATLYLAGKYRAEHAAAHAVEHMLGEPVHAAFFEDSAWDAAEVEAADAATELHFPGRDGAVALISELIERARPADTRLVRVHDHLWLRMWLAGRGRSAMQTRDMVLPLRVEAGKTLQMNSLDSVKNRHA